MKKLDWILVLAIIPLGESYKLFYNISMDVQPAFFSDYKLDIQWVVKDVSTMLQFFFISIVAYRLSRYIRGIGQFRLALKAMVAFGVFDICMYFLTFKCGWYSIVYYALIFLLIKVKIFK